MMAFVVVVMMMMMCAALTASCLRALVAGGRPTQTPCGAIDPSGRPTVANGRPNQTPRGATDPTGRTTVANGRPAQTPCGTIDPNGRHTVANGRPAQTPCGAHSTHGKTVQASLLTHQFGIVRLDAIPVVSREPGKAKGTPTHESQNFYTCTGQTFTPVSGKLLHLRRAVQNISFLMKLLPQSFIL